MNIRFSILWRAMWTSGSFLFYNLNILFPVLWRVRWTSESFLFYNWWFEDKVSYSVANKMNVRIFFLASDLNIRFSVASNVNVRIFFILWRMIWTYGFLWLVTWTYTSFFSPFFFISQMTWYFIGFFILWRMMHHRVFYFEGWREHIRHRDFSILWWMTWTYIRFIKFPILWWMTWTYASHFYTGNICIVKFFLSYGGWHKHMRHRVSYSKSCECTLHRVFLFYGE